MMDFSPTGKDAGQYAKIGDPGSLWTVADKPLVAPGPGPNYGPSSAHVGVVNVGMCDGSVQALSKRGDAANLFFLITKNNGRSV